MSVITAVDYAEIARFMKGTSEQTSDEGDDIAILYVTRVYAPSSTLSSALSSHFALRCHVGPAMPWPVRNTVEIVICSRAASAEILTSRHSYPDRTDRQLSDIKQTTLRFIRRFSVVVDE